MRIKKLRRAGIWGLACAAVGACVMAVVGGSQNSQPAPEDKVVEATPSPAADTDKELRYDGKPFAYWQTYCRTELKPERRIEALRALATLGENGYAEAAAPVIVEIAGLYPEEQHWISWVVDPDDVKIVNGKVVLEARDASLRIGAAMVPALLKGLDEPRTCQFCEQTLVRLPDSKPALVGLVQRWKHGSEKDRGVLFRYLENHPFADGASTWLAEALGDEATVRAFVTAVFAESKKPWDDSWYARAAYWLPRLKSHSHVVVPLLVARLNELKRARVEELEQEAKIFAAQGSESATVLEMPSAGYGTRDALPEFPPPPETPETRLKDHLAKLNSPARTASKQLVEVLGEFGPAAVDALPVLREAHADPSTALREAAAAATRQVAAPPK